MSSAGLLFGVLFCLQVMSVYVFVSVVSRMGLERDFVRGESGAEMFAFCDVFGACVMCLGVVAALFAADLFPRIRVGNAVFVCGCICVVIACDVTRVWDGRNRRGSGCAVFGHGFSFHPMESPSREDGEDVNMFVLHLAFLGKI